jgi:23S rRNA (cytosine1962-C5)-methyltransferase
VELGIVRGTPKLHILTPPPWDDYELIDSGDGRKLERFGPYRLVRPESQAIWSPTLSQRQWQRADAIFERKQGGSDNGPGNWVYNTPVPEQWQMRYRNLSFWARLTPFKHTGIFPEHMAHWPWLENCLKQVHQPKVLILFGYTGLMSLYAAQLGAHVCHVDASKPATRWAQANQVASGLQDKPIRWIIDDVMKFLGREERRGVRYDAIVMDPPAFGRGPKGEIWRFAESFPSLLAQCKRVLSDRPCALLINAYAINISSLALANVLTATMSDLEGIVTAGELVLSETATQRQMPAALYARWSRTSFD